MNDTDTESDGGPRPADGEDPDQFQKRSSESGPKLWLLLDADRWILTAGILTFVFAALVAAGSLHPTPAETLLTRSDSVETLFQALVTSTITGVTLVLTLSQLVLSQELGAVGEQRDRMINSISFQEKAETLVEASVSPVEPAAFLRELVTATRNHAVTLADAVHEEAEGRTEAGAGAENGPGDEREPSSELRAAVDAYVEDVTQNADDVAAQLVDAEFGNFSVVGAALDYEYSRKIHAGRRLREEFDDVLSAEADAALENLVETLELFGPAREHFKTLYFRWELAELSRRLLYAAVPALLVAIGGLLFLEPRGLSGQTLGISDVLLLTVAAATVSVLPFALLLSYILRIVTVAKTTLAMGPFVLQGTDGPSVSDEMVGEATSEGRDGEE